MKTTNYDDISYATTNSSKDENSSSSAAVMITKKPLHPSCLHLWHIGSVSSHYLLLTLFLQLYCLLSF